jgi:hypothetical protein
MPTETVDQLIEQLKRLKVQESVVLEKLSRAREHEKEAQHRTGTPRNTTFRHRRSSANNKRRKSTFHTQRERTRQDSNSTLHKATQRRNKGFHHHGQRFQNVATGEEPTKNTVTATT